MTALVDLQREMAVVIRGSSDETPIDLFRPDHLPAGDALSVYRNHHRISLSAALATTFSTVSVLIGEDAFRILAWRFLQLHPPAQPCLSEYGAEFANYLDAEPLIEELPYLADIARLDWAINLATISSDFEALNAEALSRMTADQLADMRVEPHPSMTLLRSRFPLTEICRLAREADVTELITLDTGPYRLLIFRRQGGLQIAAIDLDVFDALEKLARGETLISASQDFDQHELSSFIRQYLLSGAFLKAY